MTCGIYMIRNSVNGKMYIGQAVDIEKRWREHRSGLRRNDHDNKHLQNAWNKDGESNFEFTVICECDESQLDTMEIDYIAKLNTYDPDFGYNKTYGGEGGRHTEEVRRKISENHANVKGENHPMFGKHHSEEAKRKIGKASKGRTHSEATKKKIREKLSDANKGKNNPMYGKLGAKNPSSIPVVQLALDGELVNVYGSAHEAERECGFNRGNINSCCKNKFNREGNNIYKGYKWQYLHVYMHNIDPRIKKVILFGKEYEF